MDEPVRQLVLSNASSHEIKQHLQKQKFRSLMDHGRKKAGEGITSEDEIERVC